jgi:hypothetical protein
MLNFFKKEKSRKELEEVFTVLLPDNAVLLMIKEIADCQDKRVLSNRALLRTCQREFNKLIIAAVMVTLH